MKLKYLNGEKYLRILIYQDTMEKKDKTILFFFELLDAFFKQPNRFGFNVLIG
jgi:hypothetical protein